MVRFEGAVRAWVGVCLLGMASSGCHLGGGASAARAGAPASSAGPAEGHRADEELAASPRDPEPGTKGSWDSEEKSLQNTMATRSRSGQLLTGSTGSTGSMGTPRSARAGGAGLAAAGGPPDAKQRAASAGLYDPLNASVDAPRDVRGPALLREAAPHSVPPSPVAPLAALGAPAAAPAPHLDPNARYATTYRPGGAALVAFDAAVARGQVPAVYRDLVSDFGARYALPVPRPDLGALAVAVTTDRAAVGPGGGAIQLGITLASSETAPPRAPLSVHLVLDRSGSMDGQAIEDAKHAAEAVVAKLDADDDFSLVTFSDEATLLVPDGRVGPRRARIVSAIERVHADGGTNISSGLDLAYAQARSPGIPGDAVRLVMLLSDGRANGGDTDPEHLADRAGRAFQGGVQTSSFGLGRDFDAALMDRIADRGAGGYYYLADSSQIAPALDREIEARLRPVATGVELRVRLRPDVTATHVFGSRELSAADAAAVRGQEVAIDVHEREQRGIAANRQHDAAGGMRIFIPAFAPADRHTTMISLALPAGTAERSIASVEVRYKDRLFRQNVTRELPVNLRWAGSDGESAATEDRGMTRLAQAFGAGETILDAADRVDRGDREGARGLLDERAAILRVAAERLGEPMLAEEADRMTRMSSAVGGDQAVADPLALVVLLRGAGYGYM